MTNEDIAKLLKESLAAAKDEGAHEKLMGDIAEALVESCGRTSVLYYVEQAGEKERESEPLVRPGDTPEDTLLFAKDDLQMLMYGDNANFEAKWILRDRPPYPENGTTQEQLDHVLADLALLEEKCGKDNLLEYLESCGMR